MRDRESGDGGDSPTSASVFRDPWRWAWWAVLVIFLSLFGAGIVRDDGLSPTGKLVGLIVVLVISAVLYLMTTSKVVVDHGAVIVVNQGRRYVVDAAGVERVEVRRSRIVWCAHLVMDDGRQIPVAAVSAVINTLSGEDYAHSAVKAKDLELLIKSST